MKRSWYLGFIAVLSLLGGCATTYRFKVDALASPEAPTGGTFVMESPHEEGRPGSRLRYREAADYVQRALVSRGWRVASGREEAAMIITLEAKVSDPLNESERIMDPVYYRTWGRSQVVRTPVFDREGKRVGSVATHVYLPPETHFAGYQDRERSIIVYEKSLQLTARSPGGDELWTLSVRTVDQSSDLRSYIPLLAAAALPYVGATTDGSLVVKVGEDDEAVRYLRGFNPDER